MADDLYTKAREAMARSKATSDPDYPLFHLAPPVGRLNDPNGLVVYGGSYHAFFQFSPFYPAKQVFWGHASSTDLMTWAQHGPALAPDDWYDRNGVYSGNALVHHDKVWFHYTGNVKYPDGAREAHQCLATSTDLVNLTKAPNNPVIPAPPPGYTGHVRDPQVWRDADGSFRMLLGAQRADLTGCVLCYRSDDLASWWFEGELTFPDAGGRFDRFGYMWECPALVQVPDADTGELHDVFIFCPQGIEPQSSGYENVFACCYLIGRLSGTTFSQTGEIAEVDRGFEFYAPQVFARQPGVRAAPLLMGWLGNAGEDEQPSLAYDWVHLLSVPRELSVRAGRLVQRPRLPVQPTPIAIAQQTICDTTEQIDELAGSRAFVLQLSLDISSADSWCLQIGPDQSHLSLSGRGTEFVIDRATTSYPHGDRRQITLPARQPLQLEVVFDRSVTEVFLADGELVCSQRSYLTGHGGGVQLSATGTIRVLDASAARLD